MAEAVSYRRNRLECGIRAQKRYGWDAKRQELVADPSGMLTVFEWEEDGCFSEWKKVENGLEALEAFWDEVQGACKRGNERRRARFQEAGRRGTEQNARPQDPDGAVERTLGVEESELGMGE